MAKNRDWRFVEPKLKPKEPSEKKGCVLYARKSTAQQEGTESQLQRLRREASNLGLKVIDVVVADAEHGDALDRPSLEKLMQICEAKEDQIGKVLVTGFKRASRNSYTFAKLVKDLKEKSISILSIDMNQSTDNPVGLMLASKEVINGEFEISEYRYKALGSKLRCREKKAPTFRAPLGYLNAKLNMKTPTFTYDPDTFPIIQESFTRVSNRESISSVMDYAFLAGLRSRKGGRLSRQSFHAILRNPHYAALLTPGPEGGQRIRGNWEPLVSEDVFDRVQQILDGHVVPEGTPRQKANPCFPLARVVKCPVCGSKVSGYTMKRHRYYRCQKSSQHLHERAENIEMEFEGIIGRIELAEDARSTMEMERSKRMQAQIDEIRCREQRERQLLRSIDNMKEAIRSGRHEVNTILDIIEDDYQAIELNRGRLTFLRGCLLDTDEVLDEGMRLVESPCVAWNEASPEMRLKLAPALFPGGLTYSRQKGFLYPELELAPIFRMVSDVEDGSSGNLQAEPENQAQSSTAGFRQGIRLKRA